MKLRDYQTAAMSAIFRYFEESTGDPVVALPTGTGKAVILDEFMKVAYTSYPGTRILQATHVKELIEQNYNTLLRSWPTAPAGIYSAGLGRKDTRYPIIFAGVASAYKNPDVFGKIDLMVIDEAHLVSPKGDTMYQKLIRALRQTNPLLKVIGFTATHYRLGQGLLTEENGLFTDICFDMTQLESFNWFISQGWLVPLIPKRTDTELDVDSVHIQGGEYVQKELQEAVDREAITYEILKETIELAKDRNHWLIFGSGIEHVEHIASMLDSLGVSATFVHSKMDYHARDENIAGFKSGKYRAMVNNGILTTGFDYPEIDLIAMLRPTQSPGLWVQMLGRGTRPVFEPGYDLENQAGRLASIQASKKRNCLVLDFAGNTRRLGPINDPVIPKRKNKGTGQAPIKVCEVCGTYNHAALRFCFNCGAEFPKEVKISLGASTERLIANDEPDVPQVETFNVHTVTYTLHQKHDRPPSIRVSYYCGYRLFEEWVCLEHLGYPRKKARDWWRLMIKDKTASVPESVAEGLQRVKELKAPKKINVWINKDHPEVMSHVFDEPAA